MTEEMTKEQAWEFFRQQAAARGKTLKEFIDTDIREMLTAAWEIQQETKKPVPIDVLVMRMNANLEKAEK